MHPLIQVSIFLYHNSNRAHLKASAAAEISIVHKVFTIAIVYTMKAYSIGTFLSWYAVAAIYLGRLTTIESGSAQKPAKHLISWNV